MDRPHACLLLQGERLSLFSKTVHHTNILEESLEQRQPFLCKEAVWKYKKSMYILSQYHLDWAYFHYPKVSSGLLQFNTHPKMLPLLRPLLHRLVLPIPEYHIKGIIQHVSFHFWLLLLNMTSLATLLFYSCAIFYCKHPYNVLSQPIVGVHLIIDAELFPIEILRIKLPRTFQWCGWWTCLYFVRYIQLRSCLAWSIHVFYLQ